MFVPANYAVYLGNVPNPQGILRNRTAKRNLCNKHYKSVLARDQNAVDQEQRLESSQASWSSQPRQQMEPRDVVLDKSITDKLPSNARIVRACEHGVAHACRTIKFETRAPPLHFDSTGFYRYYFLKLLSGPTGHDIMRGEYNSMKAIHDVVPYLVPKPVAWGTLSQHQNQHFFISEHVEVDAQVVNMSRLATAVADLHQRSAARGMKFGFHVSTFIGHLAQNNRATNTWEECFSNNFRHFSDLVRDIDDFDNAAFATLSEAMLSKVIPRLLRPMETGGRAITPVLLHGNLLLENTSTSLKTHGPIIFNPSTLYGHNEYEIRELVLGRFGAEFLEAYQALIPASEPKGDFVDRVALYGLRTMLHESCLHPTDKSVRTSLVEGMRALVGKFPRGYEEISGPREVCNGNVTYAWEYVCTP